MEKIQEKWEEILARVKKEHGISDVAFKTWLEPLIPFKTENDKLYILVPSEQQMGISYIAKRYRLPIQVAVEEITGHGYEIEFMEKEATSGLTSPLQKKKAPQGAVQAQAMSNLRPNYTFENFIVGSSNRFAHSAALAVAESPGEAYNPLFIYGSPGLGKTHLMQSIGHYVLDQMPEKKVLYVTSEAFTNDVIESLRSGGVSAMTKLRNKYRTVDVLMIDDIQFIIGKEQTQVEFFNTFEQLHTAGKQMILTSDKPPKELTELDERYQSRFTWGLLADVGYPDYETRMAILRKKAELEQFQLDDEVLHYIAANVTSNVRELESALNTLRHFCNLDNTKITLEVAVRELQNIISPEKEREITPQLITEIVAEHFHITTEQIFSKTRTKNIVEPRKITMYLCSQMTKAPLGVIAKFLGRDHSTVISGRDSIAEEYDTNEEMHELIETIKKKINPN